MSEQTGRPEIKKQTWIERLRSAFGRTAIRLGLLTEIRRQEVEAELDALESLLATSQTPAGRLARAAAAAAGHDKYNTGTVYERDGTVYRENTWYIRSTDVPELPFLQTDAGLLSYRLTRRTATSTASRGESVAQMQLVIATRGSDSLRTYNADKLVHTLTYGVNPANGVPMYRGVVEGYKYTPWDRESGGETLSFEFGISPHHEDSVLETIERRSAASTDR